MSEDPTLLYLESDDEITAVVRRVRAADPGRVVVVAPGRSRATSSVVALRLLARQDREIAVVGDALTRSLAAEAGLASYASVDEARRAVPGETAALEPRHAQIHVVRGDIADETAAPLAAAVGAAAAAPGAAEPDAETRAVPVVRQPSRERVQRAPVRPRRRPHATPRPARRIPVAGVAAVAAAVLVTGIVAGALVLPAATITIVPLTEAIGPVPYEIVVEDPERIGGVAEAEAEVVATGTYTDQAPATGSVVLYNWTFFPVAVPAGTFVAAGEQAFATQSDVTVPRGQLTIAGTIRAGDVEVAVVAAAPGPAANVAAGAINVVVNEGVDAQLRGFPENPEPRVLNPAATSGGVDASGPEFTQADVDGAVATLTAELNAQVADAVAAVSDQVVVQPGLADPSIEGTADLVGTRDQERVVIRGELPWEAFHADPDAVVAEAERTFLADEAAIPEGHEPVAGTIEPAIEEAGIADGVFTVSVTVTAQSSAAIDRSEVIDRAAGLTAEEAEAELADLGGATVELWPAWVTTVPTSEWRIDVRTDVGATGAGS